MEILGRRSERRRALMRAVPLLLALLILLSACSRPGAGQPQSRQQKAIQHALAYAHCMRMHGVPGYPDPKVTGGGISQSINKGQVDPNSPQYRSAVAACRKDQPGPSAGSPSERAQARAQSLTFSRCMRSHGFPDFPDPNGQDVIVISSSVANSPRYQTSASYCESHGGSASISVQGGGS